MAENWVLQKPIMASTPALLAAAICSGVTYMAGSPVLGRVIRVGFVHRNNLNYRGGQVEVKRFFCNAAKKSAVFINRNKINNLTNFLAGSVMPWRTHEPV
jgi:hypothetical protein